MWLRGESMKEGGKVGGRERDGLNLSCEIESQRGLGVGPALVCKFNATLPLLNEGARLFFEPF